MPSCVFISPFSTSPFLHRDRPFSASSPRRRHAFASPFVPTHRPASDVSHPPARRLPCRSNTTMTAAPPSDSSAVSPTQSPSPSTMVERDRASTFSWENQWYPVHWECDIPDDRPAHVRLFGRSYAIFKDKLTGLWAACDDLCPHRLAPLTEGRLVESKTTGQTLIECAYHGWRFSCNDGTCVDIPNVPTGTPIPPRASITRFYPVAVTNIGLMFMWLGDRELADESKIPMAKEVTQADKRRMTRPGHFKRRFPFSYDTLIENLIDPSHVNWAHHGESQTSRHDVIRSDTFNVLFDNDEVTDVANGVFRAIKLSGIGDKEKKAFNTTSPRDTYITFRAPCYVYVTAAKRVEGRPESHFMLWAVPNDVNECTLFLEAIILDFPFKARLMFSIIPRWLRHTRINTFLDGDSPLLQIQRATMSILPQSDSRSQSAASLSSSSSISTSPPSSHANGSTANLGQSITHGVWRNSFVPSPGGWDSLILSFRKWYDQNEHTMPFPNHGNLSKNTVLRLSHKFINDHMRWHVDDCPCCQDTLRNMRLGAYILAAVAVMCAAASLTMISARVFASLPLLKPTIACIVVCIVAVGVMLQLVRFIKAMTYTDKAKESYLSDDMTVAY